MAILNIDWNCASTQKKIYYRCNISLLYIIISTNYHAIVPGFQIIALGGNGASADFLPLLIPEVPLYSSRWLEVLYVFPFSHVCLSLLSHLSPEQGPSIAYGTVTWKNIGTDGVWLRSNWWRPERLLPGHPLRCRWGSLKYQYLPRLQLSEPSRISSVQSSLT